VALTLTDQPDQPGGISHLSRGIASSCHQGWKNGLSSLAGGLCGPAFFVLLPSTKETQWRSRRSGLGRMHILW
jgi:hypothetical protein